MMIKFLYSFFNRFIFIFNIYFPHELIELLSKHCNHDDGKYYMKIYSIDATPLVF